MSFSNQSNTFKFSFDASVTHSATVPFVCDCTSVGGTFGAYPAFVAVWDTDGDYWFVEGGTADMHTGHGNGTDYEWSFKTVSPGVLHVYTDCPAGAVLIGGWQYVDMGSAEAL